MAETFQVLRNELICLIREKISDKHMSVDEACDVVSACPDYHQLRGRLMAYMQQQAHAHVTNEDASTSNPENTYPCMQALITLMNVPTTEIVQSEQWTALCALLIHTTVIRNAKLFPVVTDMLLKIYNSSCITAVKDAFKTSQNAIIEWKYDYDPKDAMNVHKLLRLWHRMTTQLGSTWTRFPPAAIAELSLAIVTFLSQCCKKTALLEKHQPINVLNAIDPKANWFKIMLSTWMGRERISASAIDHPEFFVENLKYVYAYIQSRGQHASSQTVTHMHVTFAIMRYGSLRNRLFPFKVADGDHKSKIQQSVFIQKLIEQLDYCTFDVGEIIIDGLLVLVQHDPIIFTELHVVEAIMSYLNKDTFGEYFSKLIKVSLSLINSDKPKIDGVAEIMGDFKRDVLTLCSIRDDNDEINNIVTQLLKDCQIQLHEMQNATIPEEVQTVEKHLSHKGYPSNIVQKISEQIKLIKLHEPPVYEKLGHACNTSLNEASHVFFELINLPELDTCFQDPTIKKWILSVFQTSRKPKTPKMKVWSEIMNYMANNLDLAYSLEKQFNISEKILKLLKSAEMDGELELNEKHDLLVDVFLNLRNITGPSENLLLNESHATEFNCSVLEHELGSFFQAEPSRFLIKRVTVGPADLPRDLVHYLLKISASRQRLPHQEVLHKYASMHLNSSVTVLHSLPQDWSCLIEYGNNMKLFQDIRKVLIESKQLQETGLYPNACRDPNTSVDWFSGCILMLLDGEAAQTNAFLHHFVTSPNAATVWPYLHTPVEYYKLIGEQVMPRLLTTVQSQYPEVLTALQRIDMSLQTIVYLILNQCFLRVLNWPEVCNCLTVCVVGGAKLQADMCACMIKHCRVQLCLMLHNNSTIWSVMRKQLATFKLHNYVQDIEKLNAI